MPPTRPFPDPAPLAPPEEPEDDAETVQMGGPELQALLANVKRDVDLGRTPAPLNSRTPTLPSRHSAPPTATPEPEPVARWPWLLAALAVALLVALAVGSL
jgi:hypothetical protein